ncbi:manganese/iron transport system ATP-binding protein [Paucidesulfovibrio gracilis DSM 16080]|uniref:Manganese/iron transport system ATP-binding protein n=1 Tax=Paucidesulfovibrio gracilis DSM 16080 TaxID=1121449 RepID=A0A1T4WXZ5_9BACT|nr:ABC transporter ATP-binding protein [Paucidesulfovibrio gracilis]SKA82027.1 manganese/iron transport system ATP-binding protein [Paucidesulfovibrio gracilis DSM 16080]
MRHVQPGGGSVAEVGEDSPVLILEDVAAAYGRHVAMRGVSLRLRRGEFLGVIGPNGAGKTTLLTVLNGLGRIVAGRVEVLGIPVTGRTARHLRRRIGYVAQLQEFDPLLPMTVTESVLTGCYGRLGLLRRVPASERRKAEEFMQLVGLSGLEHRPLGHLSGGERQRAAIARALLQRPEILLLDEPTASLDWQAQRGILELIRTVHERFGLTSLIVTHDLNTLPDVCTRIASMKDGRLVRVDTPRAMADPEMLSELYGTRIRVIEDGGRTHLVY